MKKTILLFAITISSIAFSQEFILTPQNFKVKADNTKEFIVVEVPNKSQAELFKASKLYINSNYKNLKGDGYNEVEPDQIVLNLSEFSATKKLLGIPQIGGDFTNRYEINFKDGKVMIKPTFQYVELPDGMGGLSKQEAFKNNGKMRIKENVFEAIQDKTNAFVKTLISALQNKSNENW